MTETRDSDVRPRRLTTILAADVVNYSGMMAADEEGTLETLKAFRGTFEKMFTRHGGRLFNTAGDSVLAEFGSAVEAVRCAIAIQDELVLQNAERDAVRQMHFRIGVNIGDVLVDDDNLYGDGVNVAARLESIAPPGGICVSGSVYDFVKGKISFEFEDIGPQAVKNIPDPVRAFRLEPRDASAGPRPAGAATAAGRKRPNRLVIGGAALVALVLAGLGIAWAAGVGFLGGNGRPAGVSAAQAALMKPYVGMTVYGRSLTSHEPLTIRLEPWGVAKLAMQLPVNGRISHQTGRWRITESGRLCVHFKRFGAGRTICRILTRRNGHLLALGFDPKKFPTWTLKK